jgi:hypothetical protein
MCSWWSKAMISRQSVWSRVRQFVGTSESGSSLVETALVTPVLVLLLVAAVDFGNAYYARIAVSSAAEAGALYGVQNPGDLAGMILASKLDGADVLTLVPTASFGCECADGSGSSALCVATPTCAGNVVNYVEVDTTAIYTPIMPYPGVPAVITLNGKARMRVAQ